MRPFISGHVANSMAAEVIELLHSLLNTPEVHSDTGRSWSDAVQRVSLNCLHLETPHNLNFIWFITVGNEVIATYQRSLSLVQTEAFLLFYGWGEIGVPGDQGLDPRWY